jgi:hypothetical protein
MKPATWIPVLVFLAVSIPVVLLLNALQVGGEFRLWIAIGAGALASAFAQAKLASRGGKP